MAVAARAVQPAASSVTPRPSPVLALATGTPARSSGVSRAPTPQPSLLQRALAIGTAVPAPAAPVAHRPTASLQVPMVGASAPAWSSTVTVVARPASSAPDLFLASQLTAR
jgi:hypothetical protein